MTEDTADPPLELSDNRQTKKEKCYDNASATEIDPTDIEELRTVYFKCKHVMKKIESKYGHLLNLDKPSSKRLKRCSETVENELQWYTKKKIVFDDEGRQSTVEKPICVKRISDVLSETQKSCGNVTVEYQDVELGLPDNLKELRIMLHDPDMAATHRNKVIAKIRSLKEEYHNDIRLQKADIIKTMKENPDELLDFKGTNIATIPGYP